MRPRRMATRRGHEDGNSSSLTSLVFFLMTGKKLSSVLAVYYYSSYRRWPSLSRRILFMTGIMTLYGSLVSPSLTASSASLWAGPAPLFTISHLLVSLLLVIGYFYEMLHGEVKTQDIATMGNGHLQQQYEMRMHMALMFPTTEGHGGEAARGEGPEDPEEQGHELGSLGVPRDLTSTPVTT